MVPKLLIALARSVSLVPGATLPTQIVLLSSAGSMQLLETVANGRERDVDAVNQQFAFLRRSRSPSCSHEEPHASDFLHLTKRLGDCRWRDPQPSRCKRGTLGSTDLRYASKMAHAEMS